MIPIVLQTALGQRDELKVYGDDYDTPDGTCIRDYVHVEDLAVAHERALLRLPAPGDDPFGRVYNLGTGTGNSVLEVIAACERATGTRVPYSTAPRRPGDTARLVAGADKAKSELGWSPAYASIEAVIATAWQWHKTHPRGYTP